MIFAKGPGKKVLEDDVAEVGGWVGTFVDSWGGFLVRKRIQTDVLPYLFHGFGGSYGLVEGG